MRWYDGNLSVKPRTWFIAAAAVVAGAVGLIWYEEKKAPAPPGPTKPVWSGMDPKIDGSYTIPANTTFAVSAPTSSPGLAALTAAMTAGSAVSGFGMATGGYPYPVGSPPPANWPADDVRGPASVRWSGATGGSPLTIPAAAAPVAVWYVTGFQ